MGRKALSERKITKTISLTGNTIIMLEELADMDGEKSQSNVIEKLIVERYKNAKAE